MPANTKPIFPLVPQTAPVAVVNADSTDKKDLFTAGENGARVDSVHIASDDTAGMTVKFYINDGTTDFWLGDVAVPAGAGGTAVPWVEALDAINTGNALALKATYKLRCAMDVAVTAAKTVTVTVLGGDF